MSNGQTAPKVSQRVGTGAGRLVRASRALPRERRPAVFASLGLFFTLFLPWYQETIVAPGVSPRTASVTGWGAFSWVEAAVLLVALGVLTLLFQRAEGRAFHLPGGDGLVITAAGFWTCVLVLWRIFDKSSSTSVHGTAASLTGVEWGIFIALAVAASLAWAGNRIRQARAPEPPLPGEDANGAAPGPSAAPAHGSADPTRSSADPTRSSADPTRSSADPTRSSADPTRRSADPAPDPAAAPDTAAAPTLRFGDPEPDQPTLDQLTINYDDEA
jgi:hypothetical protein